MAFNQARAYETGGDALKTMAEIDQGIRSQQTNRLGDLEYQLSVQKAERADLAYNRQQALFNQIQDPNKRLAAYLHPESFAKSQFPDPKDRYIKGDRNNLWDTGKLGPDGRPTFIPGPDEGTGPRLWNGQPAGGPGGAAPPGGAGGPLASLGTGFQRQQGGQIPNRPAPAVFQDQINQHAQRNGFDPRILSNLVTQESGGDHSAVSDAGAKGITQIMPKTAVDPGFGVKPLANNTWEEAVRFGADYLGALNKYYMKKGKSPEEAMNLALGAYNWGPKNVDDWLAHGADLSKVPPETMGYIQNIIGPLVQQQPGQQPGQQQPGQQQPGQQPGSPQGSPQASQNPGGQNPVVPGSNLIVMRDPDNPRKYSTEFGWNPRGFDPQTGQYSGAPERYPQKAATEINMGDRTADQVGVKQRYDQLDMYRQKANTAQVLQPKLMMLREQLQALSTQGPGATSIINLLGTAQTIARAAGLDNDTIKHYTAQLTGMNPDDPETLAKATKTVNDLVNISLRTAFIGLGSASDRDSQGVMAAAPNPNNPVEANMYLIDQVLLPGVQRDMEIWERVNPLQRTDNQLLTLDDTVTQFNRDWNQQHYQKKPQADPNTPDPNKPPPAEDPVSKHPKNTYSAEAEAEIQRNTQKYPGAKKAPNGNWYMPNPNNPPGGDEPYLIINPF
jgi:hypothetical protein